MRRLVYALVSSLLACGGSHDPANSAKADTTDAGARDAGARAVVDASKVDNACTAGMASVPNSANDPCPQNDPKCPASMYNALARCGLDGKWQKGPDGAIACSCVPKGGNSNPPPTSCGDGKIEGAEQCEGGNLQGMTCNTLAPGSSGKLGCSRLTCRYDTTMCIATPTTGADAGA